jgi:hypothetical protein
MMTRNSPIPRRGIDDEVTSIARRYRIEAAATLVTVCRDDNAPASARAQAATKLLEYADGRPGAAQPIKVSDLELMDDEQRRALLHALLTRYETEVPGQFKQMMEEAYVAAMQRMASPQRIGFTRGSPEPKEIRFTRGAPVPAKQVNHARSVPGRLKNGAAAYAHTPARIARPGAAPAVPERSETERFAPDNVVPLPIGTHPVIPQHDLLPIHEAPVNGVHPDVLARSALPPRLALDSSFYRGSQYPWRKS